MSRRTLDLETIEILRRSRVEGNIVVLPAQLDRPVYLRVDKALRAMGGRWDKRAGGHVFPFPAAELLAGAASTGTVVDRAQALQFFETPPDLAARMAALAGAAPGRLALEPEAGHGAIVAPLLERGALVVAVELDAHNAGVLRDRFRGRLISVLEGDFLSIEPDSLPPFDAAVMNPPFRGFQDVKHVRAAWHFLRAGGRLAAIVGEAAFSRESRDTLAFRDWLRAVDAEIDALPRGTFRESGTDVGAYLVVATKEESR